MATQITSDVAMNPPAGQRGVGGRLAGRRRGGAIVAALALALIAAVAAGTALSSKPTDSSIPGQHRVIQQDPDADAYAMARWARPADAVDWEQAERTQTSPGWLDARGHAPAAARPQGTGHEQALEARGSVAGTTGDDSWPCCYP